MARQFNVDDEVSQAPIERVLVRKKPGPKPKGILEKEKFKVLLSFKESDFQKLKDQAGRIPLATFIKDHLRDTDII